MGNTINKNAVGFGYKYTDISQIHEWMENNNICYYQYVEVIDGNDYIMTVPIIMGEVQEPRRGCRVVNATLSGKSNPAQEQGAAITYARRYSLLMAFGLATVDDDAECLTREPSKKRSTSLPGYPDRDSMIQVIRKHYPDGSEDLQALLKHFKADSIENLKQEQIAVIFEKVGGH